MTTDRATTRVHEQAALIRALVDELIRCAPSDPRVAALREQLREEEHRLAELVKRTAAA